jgi:hypothetical protein
MFVKVKLRKNAGIEKKEILRDIFVPRKNSMLAK